MKRRELLKGLAALPFLASSALSENYQNSLSKNKTIKPKRLKTGDTVGIIAPSSGISDAEFAKALQTNRRQAASWQIAHREGMEKLTKAGIYNKDLLPAMDLQPTDAVYAVLDFQMQNDPALVRSNF